MHIQSKLPTIALMALCTSAAPVASDGDVDHLIETDKRQQRAYVDRNWSVLHAILSDDYMLILCSGAARTKAEVMAVAKSGDMKWEINENRDWDIRVYGDSAVLVATLRQNGINKGTEFDCEVRFSDTYVKRDGARVNVHAHASRLATGDAKP